MNPEQTEELEVLRSIYEGDEDFKEINESTFQYKYPNTFPNKSFIVEIKWGSSYPEAAPEINMDLFFNKHIFPDVKKKIYKGLLEQAELNLGMSMTFTLFEWLKEAAEEFLESQPKLSSEVPESNETPEESDVQADRDSSNPVTSKKKKEQLSKSQKRRFWDRQTGDGERPRGSDWVDIVKHLSQTGSGAPLSH